MLIKNSHKLSEQLNESVLTISLLTDFTADKLDLLEKYVWSTILLIMDQVLNVFL